MSASLGTEVLVESVPVTGGRLSADAGQEVPERLTFTVPEWADGRSWVPDGPSHPLAHHGQYVDLDIHVVSSVSGVESVTRMGRFPVQDWSYDDVGGTVQVECVGLLQRPLDARFRVPEAPRSYDRFSSVLRRLTPAGIPVLVDPALVDRAVPQSFLWETDRLGAMYEVADAWPARLRVDQFGTLRVLPPAVGGEPVWTATDGERGTVVSVGRGGGRDAVANVVVARSSVTDDPARPPLQAVAEVTSGPLLPATYGEVVFFWSTPLAATYRDLLESATTILARKTVAAQTLVVSCAPDPRLELDDVAEVVTGRVTTTTLGASGASGVDGGFPSTTFFDSDVDGGGP